MTPELLSDRGGHEKGGQTIKPVRYRKGAKPSFDADGVKTG